jgi:hypothetical protein
MESRLGNPGSQTEQKMKVRICQIYTIENGDDGWTEILDNDGLILTRKPTLELAFNEIVEMVTNESLTSYIEADITDVVGGAA